MAVINTSGSPGGGTPLEVTFTTDHDVANDDDIRGVYVMFNTHVRLVTHTSTVVSADYIPFFRISYETTAPVIVPLDHTLRWTHAETNNDGNVGAATSILQLEKEVAIRTFIQAADVTLGTVKKILIETGGHDGEVNAGNMNWTLERSSLCAFVLQAGS
jgi:hypothetical protein